MDNNKPYLLEDGTLVIPFECADHRYKYWKSEGMSIPEILEELEASEEIWAKYTRAPYPGGEKD